MRMRLNRSQNSVNKSWTTAAFKLGSGRTDRDMAGERHNMWRIRSTAGTGRTINARVKVYNIHANGDRYEGMFENGKEAWLGCIIIMQMEVDMRACLRMEWNMVRVYNTPQMEADKRACLRMATNMVRVDNTKQMEDKI